MLPHTRGAPVDFGGAEGVFEKVGALEGEARVREGVDVGVLVGDKEGESEMLPDSETPGAFPPAPLHEITIGKLLPPPKSNKEQPRDTVDDGLELPDVEGAVQEVSVYV